MKTLLMGIALAIVTVSASQALALPYCPHWQQGHHACATYDE